MRFTSLGQPAIAEKPEKLQYSRWHGQSVSEI
jgi:hypothetical protein